MGKKLIALLNDVTADGQVFRVDMRLRPYGDSGPLAMSFAALENYLLSQGREWGATPGSRPGRSAATRRRWPTWPALHLPQIPGLQRLRRDA